MLRITRSQIEEFRCAALLAYEAEMIAHCKSFSPKLSVVLGNDRLRAVIRAAIDRARGHGFTFEGPVRLFIELSFLFGSSFDADVQYPWARELLDKPDPSTQMQRAEALHAKAVDALERIHGPDNGYTVAALRRLHAYAKEAPVFRREDFMTVALAEMARIHPQKHAYVGESALRALIAAGEDEAQRHGLCEPRDIVLFVVLMFSLGQGCTKDPLYPWIASTLANHRVPSPSTRVRRLEKKAQTWLTHVLAGEQREVDA